MKKFILIIVFVFLIAIFISFNYLLWDREKQLESFQGISDSKNLTIETLSEKMNNLDMLNKELNRRVDTLDNNNTTLRDSITQLSNENIELRKEIFLKNALINKLKKHINVEPLEAVVKKWVEAVNSKNYKSAVALISVDSEDPTINDLDKFKDVYQNELKAIRIKSLNLYTDIADEEHIKKIQLKVAFEVDKPDNIAENKGEVLQALYRSGINEKYITMEFDVINNEWLILEIKDKP